MRFPFRPATVLAAAVASAGCASLPRDQGYAQTRDLIAARRADAAVPVDASAAQSVADAPAVPTEPISADAAVALAFRYNPRIREQYARLGIGRAELEDARRIGNPTLGYARLAGADGRQITRSASLGIADLLTLPARKRFATGELERLQHAVAAELLGLAGEVETAWYEAVSAQQVAAMRAVVAQAAEQSAALAQRFFDAGNINRLQLEQERAAAAQARIDAVRASADARRARTVLAGLIGLPGAAGWTVDGKLPEPPAALPSADALVPLALEQRLDLIAAQRAVALREDALGVSRRWRWLGEVEVGYERETETDGGVLRGPSLSLQLPIFNQGQGSIARAQAELLEARAQLDALALGVRNEARLGVERLAAARDIVERYRTLLLPRREAIVARMQEQVNFMLIGVFELILAKQAEYDAYQEYLEAVRDYWTVRTDLRRIVGGRLPDDGAASAATIGVDAILPVATPAAMDHSMHDTPAAPANDPHAGHRMPAAPAAATDPHAGHAMPEPADAATEAAPSDEAEPATHAHHDHGDTP